MAKKADFITIRIHRHTADRFREYSKSVAPSHSEAIDSMIDFFEGARIFPRNKYLMDYMGLNHYMDKRLDYIEELLRQWERNSTFPKLHKTLKKIFNQAEKEEKEQRKRRKFEDALYQREQAIKVSRYEHEQLRESFQKERRRMLEILKRMEWTSPTFGKPYYKLEMDATEFESIRKDLKRK